MIPRFLAAVVCLIGPLTCTALGGEATYVSFAVPGALGTYPMSINASMAVTGYYYSSPTVTRGFLRDADGTITTFDIRGALWTQPESINAAGNITGFYQLPPGPPQGIYGLKGDQPQGFLRYADGHIITIDPPPAAGFPGGGQPISINEFNDIAGNFQFVTFPIFTRSAQGVFDTRQFDKLTEATAVNASGSVIGYFGHSGIPDTGFVTHPDGYSATFTVPAPVPVQHCTGGGTYPDGINAEGVIAGWYVTYTNNCTTENTGAFVMSLDGVFTLFQTPGALLASPLPGLSGDSLKVPHRISIDQAGDITGSYTDTASLQHGFVRNSYGTITTFDPPEGKQTAATSINDGGAITGFYHYNSGGGPPVGFIRVP